MPNGLERLDVWKKSIDLAETVCLDVLPRLPSVERYSLAIQLRKAIQSVPANIAEAHGRYHYADAARFCYVARGSLEEAWSHVVLAERLGYLKGWRIVELKTEFTTLTKMLHGYIEYLNREKRRG